MDRNGFFLSALRASVVIFLPKPVNGYKNPYRPVAADSDSASERKRATGARINRKVPSRRWTNSLGISRNETSPFQFTWGRRRNRRG